MLLYTKRGFLGTAGFLIALTLAALALGLWVGSEKGRPRRRWLALVFAYVAAALFAVLWSLEPTFRSSAPAGALAVFFLLAWPAYNAGVVYQTLMSKDAGASAFFGAAVGVLAAARILIPQLQPGVIFGGGALILAVISMNFVTESRDGTT